MSDSAAHTAAIAPNTISACAAAGSPATADAPASNRPVPPAASRCCTDNGSHCTASPTSGMAGASTAAAPNTIDSRKPVGTSAANTTPTVLLRVAHAMSAPRNAYAVRTSHDSTAQLQYSPTVSVRS